MQQGSRDMGYAESLLRFGVEKGQNKYNESIRMQSALRLVLALNTAFYEYCVSAFILPAKLKAQQLQNDWHDTLIYSLFSGVLSCAAWLLSLVSLFSENILKQGKNILSAVPLLLEGLLRDKKAPSLFSDMGYLFRKDILPVALSFGVSSISYEAIQSHFIQEHLESHLLIPAKMLWVIMSAALIADVVIPKSLRFIAHITVMNTLYPEKFAAASEHIRDINNTICRDNKCSTLRHIKGDITEAYAFMLQSMYLLRQQVSWGLTSYGIWQLKYALEHFVHQSEVSTLSINSLMAPLYLAITYAAFKQLYISFLTAMQLGDAVLRSRYVSDGLCPRHRSETLNKHINVAASLGVLQIALIASLKLFVGKMSYVPDFMLSSVLFTFFTGLAHYMSVPAPTGMSFQSFMVRQISPLSQINEQASATVDAVIREVKEHCKGQVKKQKYVRWTWELLRHEMTDGKFVSQLHWVEKYNWLIKPALEPEFKDINALLRDPILSRPCVDLMIKVDTICRDIIDYRYAVANLTNILSAVKTVQIKVKNAPLLNNFLNHVSSFLLGPVKQLLSPELFLKTLPDGLDEILSQIQSFDAGGNKKYSDFLSQAKASITSYKKKRDFFERVLKSLPDEVSALIVCYLKDDTFCSDLKILRSSLQDIMVKNNLELYKDFDVIGKATVANFVDQSKREQDAAPSCNFPANDLSTSNVAMFQTSAGKVFERVSPQSSLTVTSDDDAVTSDAECSEWDDTDSRLLKPSQ